MSEIEEGDQVVTPIGEVCEVYQRTENFVLVKAGLNKERHRDCDVVKVNSPIRVRVSRECYAESLVALAEEYGFEERWSGESDILDISCEKFSHCGFQISPEEKHYFIADVNAECDLTYAKDLPQIEAWLEANAESEDECDDCRHLKEKATQQPHRSIPVYCPEHDPALDTEDDCTDDDSYSEPRPEDEEWLEDLKQSVCGGLSGDDKERLGFYGMTIEDIVLTLAEHIDGLESEIQDCWDNQQEYKNDVAELHRQNGHLRERIEEARKILESALNKAGIPGHRLDVPDLVKKSLEILTPDSDEGDGCGE